MYSVTVAQADRRLLLLKLSNERTLKLLIFWQDQMHVSLCGWKTGKRKFSVAAAPYPMTLSYVILILCHFIIVSIRLFVLHDLF